MHLFLTSSPCDDNVPPGCTLPCTWNARNHFVENLRACITPGCEGVVIAASPDEYDLNDEMTRTFAACMAWHGMPLAAMHLIDGRNEEDVRQILPRCGLVILGGGHVPTQQAFFERMGLRSLLRGYDGVVMGISAGSMNCAATVYAQPELPGESLDMNYQRFLPGLGLTNVNILPHYNEVADSLLDGKRLFEDITFADSFGRAFYVLVDGSYVLHSGGKMTLYGEGWRIADGEMQPICTAEGKVQIG